MVALSIIIVMSDEHAQKLVDNAYILNNQFLWVVKNIYDMFLCRCHKKTVDVFTTTTKFSFRRFQYKHVSARHCMKFKLRVLMQQIAPITSDLFESIERLTQFQCDIVCTGPTQAFITMSRFNFIPWDMEKNSQIRLFLCFHMRIWYVSMLCWHSLFSSQRTYELDTWHIHDFSKSDVVITIKILFISTGYQSGPVMLEVTICIFFWFQKPT